MVTVPPKKTVEVSLEVFLAFERPENLTDCRVFLEKGSWWLLAQGVVLVPEFERAQVRGGRLLAEGLRRWACPELPAAACAALAQVGVPFVLVSGASSLNLFVPQEKLGRALAALHQARLERFSELA